MFRRGIFVVCFALGFCSAGPSLAFDAVGQPLKAQTGQILVLDSHAALPLDPMVPLRAEWSWVSRPATSVATFSSTTALRPSVTPDVAGRYLAKLSLFSASAPPGAAALHSVTVEFGTDNLTPVAQIAARGMPGVLATTLDGTASYDVEGDSLTYAWSVISKPASSGNPIVSPTAPITALTLSANGTYVLGLTVTDSQGKVSATEKYTLSRVTSTSRQTTPIASLGEAYLKAEVGQTVTIDPYGSTDLEGDFLTSDAALVLKPAGSTASVSRLANGQFTFVADLAGTYVVSLATKDAGRVGYSQAIVEVGQGNLPPVARLSAPISAPLGAPVLLDGRGSFDRDGDFLTHAFALLSKPSGSAATLIAGETGQASLTPDVAGVYVVQLRAVSLTGQSRPVTVAIRAIAGLPVAVAGPDVAYVNGQTANLNGSGSLSATGTTGYSWSLIGLAGSPKASMNLANPTSAIAQFSFVQRGVNDISLAQFKDQLKLTDVFHDEDYNDQWIGVQRPADGNLCRYALWQRFDETPADYIPNTAPLNQANGDTPPAFDPQGYVTDAAGVKWHIWRVQQNRGPTRVIKIELANGSWSKEYIQLGGVEAFIRAPYSTSSATLRVNGDIWRTASPNLNPFSRTEPVCLDKVTNDPAASVVQLVTSDANGVALPDTLFVGHGNIVPVVQSGAVIQAAGGQPVTLTGATYGQDANGDTLTYDWSLISRPAGSSASLPGGAIATGATLTFTPDRAGLYFVQVTARDALRASRPAVVVVEVVNTAPVASAATPSDVFVGEVATLDGSASSDADGNALTFHWTVTSRPAGSTAEIPDPFATVASFTPDRRGTYTFELVVSDQSDSSDPAVITLNVPNRAPVATLNAITTPQIGQTTEFSALASSDADNDPLSYVFAVTEAPAGANTSLAALADGRVEFQPDTAGAYRVSVTVSDGIETSVAEYAFTLESGNAAPVLGPLASPYSIEVGLELSFTLTATDTEGGSLTFFAAPLPLPAGMTVDAESGLVRFRPESGLEGSYQITLGVSDGTLSDSEMVTINVFPGSQATTTVTGRVLDAADFETGITTPLAGIPVRLEVAGVSTTTDSNGVFVFSGLTAGADTVVLEPAGGPGGYVGTEREITITANQNRDLAPDFLLGRLGDGCTTVSAGVATILTDASTGITVTIAADTITDGAGAPYAGQVCLGSLPRLFDQPGLPEGTQACQIYALDAPGAVFSAGYSVTAANNDQLPATASLDVWRTALTGTAFRRAANGVVDAGGATVSATIPAGAAGLFTFLPKPPKSVPSGDQPTGNYTYSLFDGDLSERIDLSTYTAFSQTQGLSLAYHSKAANPKVVIAGDVTIPAENSLPLSLDTRIKVSGLEFDGVASWNPRLGNDGSTPALVGEAVSLRQSTPVDASGLPTGRYGYDFIATAQYACSTVSASHEGDINVQNRIDSEFGRGWSVAGLQSLLLGENGDVTIVDDSGFSTFEPEKSLTEFDGDPLVFPGDGIVDVAVADYDMDGRPDVVFADSGAGKIGLIKSFGGRDFQLDSPITITAPKIPVPPETSIYSPNLLSTSIGDMDGDGNVDLVYNTVTGGIGGSLGGYLLNDGFGKFSPRSLGFSTWHMAVDDLNQDGHLDIIYAVFVDVLGLDRVEVDYGGPIQPDVIRASNPDIYPGGATQVLTADIDNDGRPDVAYRSTHGVNFLFNNGNLNYQQVTNFVRGPSPLLVNVLMVVLDANGDGKLDVVYSSDSSLTLFLNTTGRAFGPAISIPRPPSATDRMHLAVADGNGDGYQDFLASTGSETFLYVSNGDGSFQPFVESFLDYPVRKMAVQDMDGDGNLDLVSHDRFHVRIHFSKSDANKFIGGKGEFSVLTRLSDGTWERRYKDGSLVLFDQNGRQTAEVDVHGNRKEFTYDASGRVAAVTDQAGGITSFAYDLIGRLETVAYPDGRLSSFTYDDDLALTSVTAPDLTERRFRYDENGQLVAVTDERDNTTTHTYTSLGTYEGTVYPNGSSIKTDAASILGLKDLEAPEPLAFVPPDQRFSTHEDEKGGISLVLLNEFGAVLETVDPLGRYTRFVRNEDNLVTRVERPTESPAPAGGTTLPPGADPILDVPSDIAALPKVIDLLQYDTRGNMTKLIQAAGTTLEREHLYSYDPEFSKVLSFTDFGGNTTTYEYDNFGDLTKITDPLGGERSYTYNPLGLISTMSDENGNLTSYGYNLQFNPEQISLPDGTVIRKEYDSKGNVIRVTEAYGTPLARTLVRTFDAKNRVLSEDTLDANGISIDGAMTYAYDAAGNVIQSTDADGLTTSMTYDSRNRVVAVSDPATGLMQRTYNDANEVVSQTNSDGEATSYAYDAVSRLTSATDPLGFEKAFAYDILDNVKTVTDGEGSVTTFTYDTFNRMLVRTNPLGESMSRAYDTRDNLLSLTREDDAVETASYDALSRRTKTLTPDDTQVFTYDAKGNVLSAADGDSRVTFTWDELDRLLTATTDASFGIQPAVTLTYTYDDLGRRTAMTDSLGGTTAYDWDAKGRLETLTAPWGTGYSFGYDEAGRRTDLTSTSGRVSNWTYTNGLLTGLTHSQSAVTLTDLEYGYAPDGQLISVLDQLDPSKSQLIAYDALNRLVQVAEGILPPSGVPVPTEDYAYSAEGNRLASHLSDSYASNDHHQLLEDDGYTYAYDLKGNRISRTAKATGTVESYVYDSQNRLIGYANPTLSARYVYDALERRIAKVIGAPGDDISPPERPDGLALALNGTTGLDVEDLVLTGPFTIEGWVRLTPGQTINNQDGFVRNGAGQPTQDLNFAFARLRLYSPGSGDVDKVAATTPVVAGVWTHYAVTRDAAGMLRIYINGTLDATGENPFTLPFHVGLLGSAAAGVSHARFDDIRIWSVARSGSTIASAMSTDVDNDAPGLERLYRFDDSTTEVRDYTGNSVVTPLPTGITTVTSTAPVAPPPFGPIPAPTGDLTSWVYDTADLGDTTSSNAALTFRAGALIKRWLFGPMTDEPLGYERYSGSTTPGSGSVIELFANRLGSIILAVSVSTGTVAAEYDYDSYGAQTTIGTEEQPYGFTGREHDPESGLIYFRARYYDPGIGGFVQEDPIGFGGGSMNYYAYAAANPTNGTDPSGLVSTFEYRSSTDARMQGIGAGTRKVSEGALQLAFDLASQLGSFQFLDGVPPAELPGLAPPDGTGGSHGNDCSNQRGQHIYAIYARDSGRTLKIGIANNRRLSKDDIVSYRAREQILAKPDGVKLYGHVVLLKIPSGVFSRLLAKQIEAAIVKAIVPILGPLDSDWHSDPTPEDWGGPMCGQN